MYEFGLLDHGRDYGGGGADRFVEGAAMELGALHNGLIAGCGGGDEGFGGDDWFWDHSAGGGGGHGGEGSGEAVCQSRGCCGTYKVVVQGVDSTDGGG